MSRGTMRESEPEAHGEMSSTALEFMSVERVVPLELRGRL